MSEINPLLKNIAHTSNAAQEIVLSISFYLKASMNAYIYRLYMLLEEVKDNALKSRRELSSQNDKRKLKVSLHIIYEAMESAEEMYIMLKRTMPQGIPDYLIILLDNYIKALNPILIQLAPYIVQIYGKRESLFIVTPGYQSLAEIWK